MKVKTIVELITTLFPEPHHRNCIYTVTLPSESYHHLKSDTEGTRLANVNRVGEYFKMDVVCITRGDMEIIVEQGDALHIEPIQRDVFINKTNKSILPTPAPDAAFIPKDFTLPTLELNPDMTGYSKSYNRLGTFKFPVTVENKVVGYVPAYDVAQALKSLDFDVIDIRNKTEKQQFKFTVTVPTEVFQQTDEIKRLMAGSLKVDNVNSKGVTFTVTTDCSDEFVMMARMLATYKLAYGR